MSRDPELLEEIRELQHRMIRLERQSERLQALLWLLLPVALATLALNIPSFLWILISIAIAIIVGRLLWLYLNPPGRPGDEPTD